MSHLLSAHFAIHQLTVFLKSDHSALLLVQQKKSQCILTTQASSYANAVEWNLTLRWCGFEHNLKNVGYCFKKKTSMQLCIVSLWYLTCVCGVIVRGTNTCLHEFLGRAGEFQTSVRPAPLLRLARSSDPWSPVGTRYQNSRQASPSSPSGALSKILTAMCSYKGMCYRAEILFFIVIYKCTLENKLSYWEKGKNSHGHCLTAL